MTANTPENLDLPIQPKVADIRVRRALDALDQSPRYGVQQLASVVSLSVSQLSRLFKSEMGTGLGEYITELRLRRAASLLATTNEPVKCIASAVGYHHSSSFVRAFHSRFAERPRAYRAKVQLAMADERCG